MTIRTFLNFSYHIFKSGIFALFLPNAPENKKGLIRDPFFISE